MFLCYVFIVLLLKEVLYMTFKSIEELKHLEGCVIIDDNIKGFLKGVGKLLNVYVDYNKFISHLKKYGGYTIYDKDEKPIRIVASYETIAKDTAYKGNDEFDYIIINQINTTDDMYIVFYNHELEDGYGKNNVQLVMDEHTLNGMEIIDYNLDDDSVEEILKTRQYEYNGVVYNVREISQ
jgi:hypothetical protein